MRLAKHTPEARVHSGAVGIVGYSFAVGCFWVEGLRHVGLGQLGKGAGFEAEEFEHGVEFGYVGCCGKKGYVSCVWGRELRDGARRTADPGEHDVRKGGA